MPPGSAHAIPIRHAQTDAPGKAFPTDVDQPARKIQSQIAVDRHRTAGTLGEEFEL
jgi:hypothetical protein